MPGGLESSAGRRLGTRGAQHQFPENPGVLGSACSQGRWDRCCCSLLVWCLGAHVGPCPSPSGLAPWHTSSCSKPSWMGLSSPSAQAAWLICWGWGGVSELNSPRASCYVVGLLSPATWKKKGSVPLCSPWPVVGVTTGGGLGPKAGGMFWGLRGSLDPCLPWGAPCFMSNFNPCYLPTRGCTLWSGRARQPRSEDCEPGMEGRARG